MKVIYEPKGRAREYAKIACNLYTGCSHGCKYCYAPACLRKGRNEFHGNVAPRKDKFVENNPDVGLGILE